MQAPNQPNQPTRVGHPWTDVTPHNPQNGLELANLIARVVTAVADGAMGLRTNKAVALMEPA